MEECSLHVGSKVSHASNLNLLNVMQQGIMGELSHQQAHPESHQYPDRSWTRWMSPVLVDPHRGQLKGTLWADPVDPVSCSALYLLCGLRLMPCWNQAVLDRV